MIVPLTLKQVAAQIDRATFVASPAAATDNAEGSFTRVSTDTRAIRPGDLFVALRGENFDGHHFVTAALEQGASGVVVDAPQPALNLAQLVVDDTTRALGQLAALNRAAFGGRLVAITGSAGKTSVKGMTAAILAERGQVHATRGNLNNHIGVPLTLLELESHHQFAVIEMGANAAGEIAYLTRLAGPDVAMVNNVMPAHLEGFGSIEGVARAKAEIFSGLGAEGTAIVNLDDNYAPRYRRMLAQGKLEGGQLDGKALQLKKVLTFSLHDTAADFRAPRSGSDENGNMWFELQGPAGTAQVNLQVMGQHNVANALAAAACGFAMGAELADIVAGLAKFQNIAGRMQVVGGAAGSTIIDDSYNANPSSVRAAVDTLVARPGETVLVLGDLAELGDGAADLHRQLGDYARRQGVERLVTVGRLSRDTSAGFGPAAAHFSTHEAAVAYLRPLLHGDMVLLVKGSFSSHMGKVVRALTTGGEQ